MSYLSRDTASLSCFNKSALSVRLNLLLPPQGTYDFTERKDTRIGIKLLNPGRKRRGEKKKGEGGSRGSGLPEISGGRKVQGSGKEGTAPRGGPCDRDSGHPPCPPPPPPGAAVSHTGPQRATAMAWRGKNNKQRKKKKKRREKKRPIFGANWAAFWTHCKPGLPGRKSQMGPDTGLFFSRWARTKRRRRRRFSHVRLENLIPKGAN